MINGSNYIDRWNDKRKGNQPIHAPRVSFCVENISVMMSEISDDSEPGSKVTTDAQIATWYAIENGANMAAEMSSSVLLPVIQFRSRSEWCFWFVLPIIQPNHDIKRPHCRGGHYFFSSEMADSPSSLETHTITLHQVYHRVLNQLTMRLG